MTPKLRVLKRRLPSTYFDTTGTIFRRSAAASLEYIPTDSVLADVVTVSGADQDKWVPRAVHSWAREECHPTPVPSPEAPGPQGTQPRMVLGVPKFVKVDRVGAGS